MPRPFRSAALTAAALLSTAVGVQAQPADAAPAADAAAACPWVGSSAPVETKVGQVLAQMTLEEKISLVHGIGDSAYTGATAANPRLCIPKLTLQDGPLGVRMADTTQLPSGTSVAASFDRDLATSYGSVIGAEDKAKGVDVDLGPTVNIVRDPRWGRAFESYGEDPYLAGQIGTADINGIQSQGVMAQLKHWAVYNQETNRNSTADDVVIDDRTVHEIYTSAFGAIVADSHPASAMCSYSVVNGHFACESAYLNRILKDDFGFDGFITSDWWGTHSTVASANAGMDMEMPNSQYFGQALKAAVQDGKVAQSRVDDMVARILRQEFRFGLIDHPSADTPDAVASTADHVAFAKKAAEDGTVLLKNADSILPLDDATVDTIAVIGQGAGANTTSHGGGSAVVDGTGTVTPFEGVTARAGSGVSVRYAQGTASAGLPTIPAEYLTPSSGTGHGLTASVFANQDFTGTPAVIRVDPEVKFLWTGSPATGIPSDHFAIRWAGTFTPPTTGTYTLATTSDDGSRLWVDGVQKIDNWGDHGPATVSTTLDLTAGKPVDLRLDYFDSGGDGSINLGFQGPGALPPLDAAVQLAKDSDVAIVYADLSEGEGNDLTDIDLADDQTELIEAVAAANPNTVVVLNTGSAVTMPWLDKVKGVVEAWYPGQESGNAIASLLFGDVNPSGKLPVTFPKSLEQVPASTTEQWPGVGGKVHYTEGLKVGYRWYDEQNLEPLFPFGYGLSYTTFAMSNLDVREDSLKERGTVHVSVDVTNTGTREGAQVVQVYLSAPSSTGEPANQLKGFEKVHLKPGRTRRVHLTLHARDASYWSTSAQAWTLGTGTYTVRVGDSSRHLPLSDTFTVSRSTGPRSTAVSTPKVVQAGTPFEVTTTFTNGGTEPAYSTRTTLALPAGWSAQPLTTATWPAVSSGGTVSTRWWVTVPVGERGGTHTLKATTAYSGGPLTSSSGSADLEVAFAGLATAFDTVGTTDDADPAPGNYDGAGYSYSAPALAASGVTPGAAVPDAPQFTWPDVPAGTPNAVTTAGQVVALTGAGTTLSLLGSGTNGAQSGDLTVTYIDGTTSTATVRFADWWSNEPTPEDTLAIRTDHWNLPVGSTQDPGHDVSVYTTSVPLTAGKQVAYVTLPSNSQLHVFAVTVG